MQMRHSPEKIIFFLGSHRTGSTLLSNFFSEVVPDAGSCHQHLGHQIINVMSTMVIDGKLPRSFFHKAVNSLFVRPILNCDKKIWVETHGFSFLAVETALHQFPDAPVIHMIRDPRSFVTSMINWRHLRLKGLISHYLLPWWDITGPIAGQMNKSEWSGLSDMECFAWQWKYKNTFINEHYSHREQLYKIVRLEDLTNINTREETLENLMNFLSIKLEKEWLSFFDRPRNAGTHTMFPHWSKWTYEQCQKFDDICGDLMREYKYGTETEWQDKFKQK